MIADFADRTHTGDKLLFYETCVALGGIIGISFFFFTLLRRMRYRFASASFCVRGGTSSVWGFFAGIFCQMLVDGACGDIKCFSDLYAPRANRQIRCLFCDRRSIGKGLGAGLFFLKGW